MIDSAEFYNIFENCKIEGDKIILYSDLHDAIKIAYQGYGFDMLKDIAAIDRGDKGVELTYHLYSTGNEEDLYLTITAKEEAESIIDLFKSAIADENEIYDLFGIKFTGNDRLKRLYMPQDWEGFPLRKDYVEKDSRLAWNDDNNA